jgi:hypothetical protein
MKAEFVPLRHATSKSADYHLECAEVARKLAVACVGLSLKHGWPIVLDSMLSAYYTLALEQVGPVRIVEVLTDLADETLRRRQ